MRAGKLVLVLVLAGSVAYAQSPEQLYSQGQRAYDEKRYDDAVGLWTRSYEASKLPALLFNIAQAYRLRAHAGDCTKAIELYRRFMELDPKSPQRATAQGLVTELTPCPAEPPPPVVTPPPPPPPQPVQPTVQPAAPAPAPPPEGNPGSGKRLIGIVGAVASTGVLATGFYFGHKASQLGDEVTAACKAGCIWSTVASKDADGRSAERTQWILLGVGGAGLVASGVIYWMGSTERTHVALVPRGDGAALTWSGSW